MENKETLNVFCRDKEDKSKKIWSFIENIIQDEGFLFKRKYKKSFSYNFYCRKFQNWFPMHSYIKSSYTLCKLLSLCSH